MFVGDSVTRQLFFTIAHASDSSLPAQPLNDDQKHSDYILTSKDRTEFLFVWDPYLNTTRTRDILRLRDSSNTSSTLASIRTPAMIVIGSGLWFLRYAESSGGLPRWEATIEETLDLITKAGEELADTVVFLPVEDVVASKLSPQRASSIRNSDIDAMNSDLMHRIDPLSARSFTTASNFFKKTSPHARIAYPCAFNRMLDPSLVTDGLHYSDKVLKNQVNILLNFRCNEVLPKKFPFDKTCCRSYPSVSFHQFLILILLASWGPIARWAAPGLGEYLKNPPTNADCPLAARRPRLHALFPGDDHIMPLSVFGLAILLTFIADRTPVWLKEQKQYDPWIFGAWTTFSLIAGLLTMKKADKDLGFLNREQTDEWKGWMQSMSHLPNTFARMG